MVQNLEEEVTYTFTVRAQTIDYGPAIVGNVTTGPQEGSPASPRDLLLVKSVSSVDMHWKNGPSGKGPIMGYYIESRKRGEFHITKNCNNKIKHADIQKYLILYSFHAKNNPKNRKRTNLSL